MSSHTCTHAHSTTTTSTVVADVQAARGPGGRWRTRGMRPMSICTPSSGPVGPAAAYGPQRCFIAVAKLSRRVPGSAKASCNQQQRGSCSSVHRGLRSACASVQPFRRTDACGRRVGCLRPREASSHADRRASTCRSRWQPTWSPRMPAQPPCSRMPPDARFRKSSSSNYCAMLGACGNTLIVACSYPRIS